MPQIINYETEQEWHEHRARAITSSEVSALFGENPYTTEYELYHRKKDGLIVHMDDNDRLRWGRRLESPIAYGLAEDNGWEVKPLKVFMLHSTCDRYGSSFDFEIRRGNEKGLFEMKNVDFKEYKEKWITDGDEFEAPVSIEIQLQSELEVANSNNPEPYTFGVIGALIGGNKPIIIERAYDAEMGALICNKVTTFWRMVDEGIEPLPDYVRDGDVIKKLYADVSGNEIDLSTSNRFAALIGEYGEFQKAESTAKKAKDAAKAEMITLMGNAGIAKCGKDFVTRKTVNRAGYVVEPCSYQDMRIKLGKGE